MQLRRQGFPPGQALLLSYPLVSTDPIGCKGNEAHSDRIVVDKKYLVVGDKQPLKVTHNGEFLCSVIGIAMLCQRYLP